MLSRATVISYNCKTTQPVATDADYIEYITGKIAISSEKWREAHDCCILAHPYGGGFSVTGDSVGESPEADEMSLDSMMKTRNIVHSMMTSTT